MGAQSRRGYRHEAAIGLVAKSDRAIFPTERQVVKKRSVVCIALDACDPALARAFAATGAMPNLADLLREAACCTIVNPSGLFGGALGFTCATALRRARHAFHCGKKFDPTTYNPQQTPPRLSQFPSFWKRLSDEGCRVAA